MDKKGVPYYFTGLMLSTRSRGLRQRGTGTGTGMNSRVMICYFTCWVHSRGGGRSCMGAQGDGGDGQ